MKLSMQPATKLITTLMCATQITATTFAQTNIPSPHHLIIKTNLLNTLFIPSIHAEYQIGKRLSVQGNFHRTQYTFINSTERKLSVNIEARYYILARTTGNLTGMYLSAGPGLHHDYNSARFVDSNTFYNVGETSLMLPVFRLGGQIRSRNTKWYGDFGAGLANLAFPLKRNDLYNQSLEFRAMLALGYRIL
jgi:hypothetical protein